MKKSAEVVTSLRRPDQLDVERTERLRPDDKRSAVVFSRLGYKFTEAVADLVDNSIDAGARQVLIRFVRVRDEVARVLIADNGCGMDDVTLREAMRFGSRNRKGQEELGKYGVGLKTASLSQATNVTVLSKRKGRFAGRRWTADNIGKGWICDVFGSAGVAKLMGQDLRPLRIGRSGTIVIWEKLEHIQTTPASVDEAIKDTIREIVNELGLRFHRFLASRKLRIFVDAVESGKELSVIHIPVAPLDPFSYDVSGKAGYPKTFNLQLKPYGTLRLECHIWEPKSTAPGYKLGGGKVSARQGFYFYRNDRLIQAGGWNKCRDDDSEPHLSLARVKVDLPPEFDGTFKLDIRKSTVEPPPSFPSAVNAISNSIGSFQQYILDANDAYRRHKKKLNALFRFVPGNGIPFEARRAVKRILWEPGTGKPAAINFVWKELDPDVFVEIDHDRKRLLLNSLYRNRVLKSQRASAADAPLTKFLLLLLFQEELDRKMSSERSREWFERINHASVAMLKRNR